MSTNYSIDYWNQFYRSSGGLGEIRDVPSQFAAFVLNEFFSKKYFFDIGCGGGRDSIFFAAHGRNVVGLDASSAAISLNSERTTGMSNLTFQQLDFESKTDIAKFSNNFGDLLSDAVIYSRFFLHAVGEDVEDNFISFCCKNLKSGCVVCLEYRTPKDLSREKSTASHYRRFVSPDEIKKKFFRFDAKLIYEVEGTGMAKYKNDDAHVCRMIFEITND
jgi:SAM-dependent methyltransferase